MSRFTLAGLAVLAVLLRTDTWWFPHTLFGVMEYDDGVYYGAAKLLLHGHLPYSGFTIVHPPVLSLVLLPAAGLGALFGDPWGMASARIEMQLVAVLNVLLVYRLALRLPGSRVRPAALVAAGLYAISPDAVVAEHTVLLEPFVNLFCLLAVLVVLSRPTRRSALLGGVLITAALGVKLFAGVYLIALLVWLVARSRDRVLPFLVGLAGGAVVLVLPFVISNPSAAFHDVIVTQLSRPKDASDNGLARLVNMVGLGYATTVLGLLLLAVVLVVGARSSGESRLWLAVLVLGGAAFMSSASYFQHYGAFLAPPLVLVASRLVAVEGRVRLGVTAALAVGFLVGTGVDLFDAQGQADLGQANALIPAGACVYTDAISLTIAADAFSIPSASCPGYVDGRGVALTQNTSWPSSKSFYPAGFKADSRWQASNVAQMQHASYLLLRSSPATFPEWALTTRAYVLAHFRPIWVQHHGRQHSELWKRSTAG